LAAAGADGNVYLIGATDTPTLLRGHNRALRSVAYSTSGLYLISGGDDTTVIAWDVARQAQRGRFRRHTGAVAALQFAQVDTRFVSGGADGQAFLWDSGLESQGRLEDKLIIVAGGGDYALNPIKDETFNLAQRAYTIARTRGYSDSNILYLSSYWDSPSRQDALAGKADGPATRDSIREGITEWSGDARRLFVMFLDHGEREAQQPSGEMEWFFLIAERTNPGGGVVRERVSATEVDTWLDQVQGGLDPLPDAILYADMCYAGGFVKRASAAPGTAGRTVIASTGEDRLAVFGGGASAPLSFTSFFLSAAHLGNNLADSFSTARETMSNLRIPKDRPQSPELDSDGDGVYTGLDVPKARDRGFVLGNRLAYGLTPPIITNAAAIAPIIAPVAVPVELQLTGEVQRAEVFIVFADTDYGNQIDPVSNFQSITLARQGISSRWRGTIPANTFTAEGDYTVFYSVSRTDTLESNIDLFAQPQVSTIRFDSTPQTILPHGWTLQ
jgi:WD40 repeat protein